MFLVYFFSSFDFTHIKLEPLDMLIDFSLNLSFLVYKMGIMIKGNGTCPVPSMHAKYAGGYHAKVPRGSLDTRLQ